MFGIDDAVLIPAAVSLFNGIMGSDSQSDTNSANQANAREQMAFQERMSSTAHQRETTDLITAGLNPILSANKTGASTPQGAMAVMQSPYMAGVNAASGSARSALDWANSAKSNSEKARIEEETRSEKVAADQAEWIYANFERLLRARIVDAENKAGIGLPTSNKHLEILYSQADKIKAEIANLAKEGDLLEADTANVKIETVLKKYNVPEASSFASFFSSAIGKAVPYVREGEGVIGSATKLYGVKKASDMADTINKRFRRR